MKKTPHRQQQQIVRAIYNSPESLAVEKPAVVTNRRNTKPASIEIYEGFKHYHIHNHWNKVLNGYNMKASSGEIYAILGPQASGKTTVLRILLGLIKLSKGDVEVFGFKPTNSKSGIPGSRVGYMPQTNGVHLDFTIDEILRYYASLLRLHSDYTNRQIAFLYELLNLPSDRYRLTFLDDNIRRRVSFAIAIMHNPQLLILDEPTRGINPDLKKSIWKHMRNMANLADATIIFTTQSSIEAEKAHRVGILRDGQNIIEGDPQSLITRNNELHLEEIYARVYAQSIDNIDNSLSTLVNFDFSANLRNVGSGGFNVTTETAPPYRRPTVRPLQGVTLCMIGILQYIHFSYCPNPNNMLQLTWKNTSRIFRNLTWFLAMLVLPVIVMVMSNATFGSEPNEIPVGVYNAEVTRACSTQKLSCQFLMHLNMKVVMLKYYRDERTLRRAALNGDVLAYVIIPRTFSDDIYMKLAQRLYGMNGDTNPSYIQLSLDKTNIAIAFRISKEFRRAERLFFESLELDISTKFDDYPFLITEPLFGSPNITRADFITPGMLIEGTFLLAMSITVIHYMFERDTNLLDMSYMAGVNRFEHIIGYVIPYGIIIVLHSVATFGLLRLTSMVTLVGTHLDLILVVCAQMFFGMSVGTLIAIICLSKAAAIAIIVTHGVSANAIAGVLWSTSALPNWLVIISHALPQTRGINAARAIIQKGFSLDNPIVLLGITTPIYVGIIILLLTLCLQTLLR